MRLVEEEGAIELGGRCLSDQSAIHEGATMHQETISLSLSLSLTRSHTITHGVRPNGRVLLDFWAKYLSFTLLSLSRKSVLLSFSPSLSPSLSLSSSSQCLFVSDHETMTFRVLNLAFESLKSFY